MRLVLLTTALVLCGSSSAAQDSCVVTGHLFGHDGTPMPGSYLRTYEQGQQWRRVTPRADGSFSFVVPRPGGYFLVFAGVHHKTLFMPLLLEHSGPFELNVRLSAAEFVTAFDSVRVVGDFNSFKPEGAVPMSRRSDGTFVAMVPCDQDTLHYQLLGVEAGGLPVCGTQADTFVLARGRPLIGNQSSSFVSTLRADRRPLEIVFDPARLPRATDPPIIRFADSLGAPASIVAIHADAERRGQRMADAYEAFRAGGGVPDSFRWDPSPDLKDIAIQIDRERDPLVRGFLLLTYVRLALGDADSARVRRVFTDIPPDSPIWSLQRGGPSNVYGMVGRGVKDPAAARRYAESVVETHPDSSVCAAFLFTLLVEAHESGDRERAGRYYTRLAGDYSGTTYAEWSRKRYGPGRAITKDKRVPAFAFASLDDSTHRYRPVDFKGKYLLLDFWATWCGPCIGELSYLHRAYDDYKDRGLVILSISFDETPEAVRRFRGPKWPMPWWHAFQPKGFTSEAARTFEIVGIPRAILVDPWGKIVAVDGELRREKLDQTLSAVLGSRATDAPTRTQRLPRRKAAPR